MKKATKVSLIVVGVLVALYVLFITCADVWVSRYAEKRVRAELAKAELPYTIDFKRIHVLIMGHFVAVEGITFDANKATLKEAGLDTLHVEIPRVSVSGIRYLKALREKTVAIDGVDVHKLCAYTKVTKTKMAVKADSVSVGVNDLFFCWADTTYGYNDSVYDLSVNRLQLSVPQSMIKIDAHDIKTEDGGPITLGKTRIWNSVGRRELAPRLKEPATWIDLSLKSVKISPMNPFRTDFTKGLHVNQISVISDRFEAFRDARLQPTHPYPMPQKVLMQLKYPIQVDAIDAQLKTIDVGVLCTDKNLGEMQIKNIKATICDFSNKPGTTAKIDMNASVGDGKVNGKIKMHMNKAGLFDIEIKGKDVNTKELARMTRPLAAIELTCAIDSMHLKYQADDTRLDGKVLFAYHGLSGKVYARDDIPFKIISQNAGALEYFVNNLIPKSNPRKGLKEPLAYRVEYVRKDMQPVPLYLMMPVILGAVETYLPGFSVSKKVNKNDI